MLDLALCTEKKTVKEDLPRSLDSLGTQGVSWNWFSVSSNKCRYIS